MRGWFGRAVTVAACALCLLGTGTAWAQGGVIRIGVLYDLGGPLAPAGSQDAYLGSKFAIDMINERGGVAGMPAVPIVADAQSQMATALATVDPVMPFPPGHVFGP